MNFLKFIKFKKKRNLCFLKKKEIYVFLKNKKFEFNYYNLIFTKENGSRKNHK